MLKLSFVFSVLTLALFVSLTTSTSTDAREVKIEKERANNRKWCIAKPSTPDTQLEMNMEFVCGSQRFHQIDCSVIQQGGSCYNPSNKVSSASMVMNLYFQADGQAANGCIFNGSGMIIYENPTVGNCTYPA